MHAALALAGATLVLGCAAVSLLAPVWTYALGLALFGLPHVACELRYLDRRFAARLPDGTWRGFAIGLVGIVLLRAGGLAGLGTAELRTSLEFGIGALLVAIWWHRAAPLRPAATALGGALVATAVWAATQAPLPALVVFAVLHNATPLGLLAERLDGRSRRRALLAGAVVFGAMPLLLASGLPGAWLAAAGACATEAGPLGVGGLDDHIGVFVPAGAGEGAHAFDLFAMATYLQCMHYAVVLGVLPRLDAHASTAGSRLPWPAPRTFWLATAAATAVLLVGYATGFAAARSLYGVFAAVHAWAEVPALLLALSPRAVPVARLVPA
jgi:hypothetical protein